jgi:hypothetical protein
MDPGLAAHRKGAALHPGNAAAARACTDLPPPGNEKIASSGATFQRDGQISKSLSRSSRKNILLFRKGKSVL